MKIKTLYEKYEIMPQLATHQLRVGGIAKLITDSWKDKEMAQRVVNACLIHDMGNIVKFDLSDQVQEKLKMMKPAELPFWRERQQKYRGLFGKNAQTATHSILRAEGLDRYVTYLENEAQLYKMRPRREDFLIAGKPAIMVLYADLRVGPKGVITMQERIEDLLERYGGERAESKWGASLEGYIQELSAVDLVTITETLVVPLFESLLDYEI